jgi:hypothetical protein
MLVFLNLSIKYQIRVTRLGNFLPIRLLLEAECELLEKFEVAQRNGDNLGNILLHILTKMSNFKTWFFLDILGF